VRGLSNGVAANHLVSKNPSCTHVSSPTKLYTVFVVLLNGSAVVASVWCNVLALMCRMRWTAGSVASTPPPVQIPQRHRPVPRRCRLRQKADATSPRSAVSSHSARKSKRCPCAIDPSLFARYRFVAFLCFAEFLLTLVIVLQLQVNFSDTLWAVVVIFHLTALFSLTKYCSIVIIHAVFFRKFSSFKH